MTKISCGHLASKHWDEGPFAQFQRDGCNEASKRGEVVFVGMTHLFDDAVFTEAANDGGDLACVFPGQVLAQVGVFESADHKLATKDNGEQLEVVAVEEVEATVGAVVGANGFGHFVELFDAVGGIVDGGPDFFCLVARGQGTGRAVRDALAAVDVGVDRAAVARRQCRLESRSPSARQKLQ